MSLAPAIIIICHLPRHLLLYVSCPGIVIIFHLSRHHYYISLVPAFIVIHAHIKVFKNRFFGDLMGVFLGNFYQVRHVCEHEDEGDGGNEGGRG